MRQLSRSKYNGPGGVPGCRLRSRDGRRLQKMDPRPVQDLSLGRSVTSQRVNVPQPTGQSPYLDQSDMLQKAATGDPGPT